MSKIKKKMIMFFPNGFSVYILDPLKAKNKYCSSKFLAFCTIC